MRSENFRRSADLLLRLVVCLGDGQYAHRFAPERCVESGAFQHRVQFLSGGGALGILAPLLGLGLVEPGLPGRFAVSDDLLQFAG